MEVLDTEKASLLSALKMYLAQQTDQEVFGNLSDRAITEVNQLRIFTARLIGEMRAPTENPKLVHMAAYDLSEAELLNIGLVDLIPSAYTRLWGWANNPDKGLLMLKAVYFLKQRFSQ